MHNDKTWKQQLLKMSTIRKREREREKRERWERGSGG